MIWVSIPRSVDISCLFFDEFKTSNNKVVTELPEVDVIDVMINPPDIVPTLIAESNSPITVQEVNLNESVDYAILIYVIILFVIITIFIMFLKKGKLLWKKNTYFQSLE